MKRMDHYHFDFVAFQVIREVQPIVPPSVPFQTTRVVWNETFGSFGSKTEAGHLSSIVHCSGDMLFLANIHSHNQGATSLVKIRPVRATRPSVYYGWYSFFFKTCIQSLQECCSTRHDRRSHDSFKNGGAPN
jgi:hypothetical protein